MLDKIFVPTLRNCPHRDCRRLLDKITTHHGMVFCPYCHKSIVVNPVSASINLAFGGFFKCYVKNNYKWLSVFLSVLVVFYYTIVFVDDYMANVSDVLFIGIMLLFVVLFGFLFYFEKYQKPYIDSRLPIMAGVDKLSDINKNHDIAMALENLSNYFYGYAPQCPHCQSQYMTMNLHHDNFHCQKCHNNLMPNKKISYFEMINSTMIIVWILFIISVLNLDAWFVLFVVGLIMINTIQGYMVLKTNKWLK